MRWLPRSRARSLLAGAAHALVLSAKLGNDLPRLRVAERPLRLRPPQRLAQLADAHHLLLRCGRLVAGATALAGGARRLRHRLFHRRLTDDILASWRRRSGDSDSRTSRRRACPLNRRIHNTRALIHLRRESSAIAQPRERAPQRFRAGFFDVVGEIFRRLRAVHHALIAKDIARHRLEVRPASLTIEFHQLRAHDIRLTRETCGDQDALVADEPEQARLHIQVIAPFQVDQVLLWIKIGRNHPVGWKRLLRGALTWGVMALRRYLIRLLHDLTPSWISGYWRQAPLHEAPGAFAHRSILCRDIAS